MPIPFYEMRPRPLYPSGAYFDTPRRQGEVNPNPWEYMQSRIIKISERLTVPYYRRGTILDMNMTAFGTWIVKPPVGQLLGAIVGPDQLQRIECSVEDGMTMEILNTLILLDCFDHERSEGVAYFTKRERPDREGFIRSVLRRRIHPEIAIGHNIFRIARDELTIVVSEKVKEAMEAAEVTGVSFHNVTP